ncbi:MAG: panthothenate synthetase [Terracidiphilus sp.]
MRMIMLVQLPVEPFNTATRKGTAGAKMKKILDATKPEAVYFTEREGHRGGILIVDVESPSDIPRLAEPWFLSFNAEVEFRIAMTPEDLGQANLNALGKKWA